MSPSICFSLLFHLFTPNLRCARAVALASFSPHPKKKLLVGPFSSIQEDKGRRDSAAFFASLSFLSNGLEMYYYANVNFDTELKKRCFFFFFKKKKKVLYVVSIASLFCKWIVNYAFCWGGVGEEEVALLNRSAVSVSMVHPCWCGGKEKEWWILQNCLVIKIANFWKEKFPRDSFEVN